MLRRKLEYAGKKIESVTNPVSFFTSTIGAGAYGLNELGTIAIPQSVSFGIDLGWGYSEAFYSLISGINYLLDSENHHRTQNKIKGILQIFSSAQLCLLTYHPYFLIAGSATTLGTTGFAVAMLIESISAGMDLYNANKRRKFSGWLDDTITEINHLQKSGDKKDKSDLLIDDIISRCRYQYNNGKSEDKINRILDNIENEDQKARIKREYSQKYEENSIHQAKDRRLNLKIHKQCQQDFQDNLLNFAFKTIGFVGMSFIAASFAFPPLALPGMMLFAASFIFAITQKVQEIDKSVSNSQCTLFSRKAEKTDLLIPSPKLVPAV